MQSVVQAWLVYRLGGSAFWLGMIPVCQNVPAFIMTPVTGVLCDRVSRRNLLIFVQCLAAAQACVLAALVASGRAQVWHVLALSGVLGVCSGIDITTRHAFAVDLVPKEDLSAAISLNAVLQNGARIMGPALAGLLIGPLGEAGCFALNALTCVPQIFALSMIRPRGSCPEPQAGDFLGHMREGVAYARRHPVILEMIVFCGMLCFFASSYGTLLPVFAKTVLGGDARTLGWLGGAMGLGAMCGTYFVAPARDAAAIDRQLGWRMACWGAGLALLGLSRVLWLSLIAQFVIGVCMMSIFPIMNNTIQNAVSDAMRGRVLSLYTMAFIGLVPLGSLIVGGLADRFGAPAIVMGSAVLTACFGVFLWGRRFRAETLT
jgi:MFS family permease